MFKQSVKGKLLVDLKKSASNFQYLEWAFNFLLNLPIFLLFLKGYVVTFACSLCEVQANLHNCNLLETT